MRFVILHYHFLKNAGMAMEDILHRRFGAGFLSIDSPDRDGHVSTAALLSLLQQNPLLKAVSSHQIRYPVPLAPGFLFFDLCFLRDPIDRIRSTYDYFREKPAPGDPVSDLANALNLGLFIQRLVEEMPWHLNNAQVNLLANGIANDPPTPGDFDRAVAKMLQTSFLGVVDRFEESLVAGRHFLQLVFPEMGVPEVAQPERSAEAANATTGLDGTLETRVAGVRDACPPNIYAELLRLNTLDSKLVDLARSEVLRRFKQACR